MTKPDIPENKTMPIAESGNQGGIKMSISEAWASRLYDLANWALIVGLVLGVVSTIVLVWMGNVKEAYLKDRTTKAETALLTLQEHNKPRALIASERGKVVAALKAFPPQNANLFAYSGDNEIVGIANEIVDLLGPNGAGWTLNLSSGNEMDRAVGGILVEVNGAFPPVTQLAAENLVLALRDEKLTTFGPSPLGNTATMGVGPSDPKAPIRITIGKKL